MEFDFKKQLGQKIRSEIKPLLIEHGFVQSKPTHYVREQNGLLQYFYFRLEKYKLRPWVYYLPIFEPDSFLSFGSDACDDTGFQWIALGEFFNQDIQRQNYTSKVLPAFERLKASIVDRLLPEMDKMQSLAQFIDCCGAKQPIFGQAEPMYAVHFAYIAKVYAARGQVRLALLQERMKQFEQVYPKQAVQYLKSQNSASLTEEQADQVFAEFCNQMRVANKLVKIKES